MGLCTRCGLQVGTAEVCISRGIAVSENKARAFQREAEELLLRNRRLALVLDLDETLVSTCHEAVPVLPGESLPAAAATPGQFVVFGRAAHRMVIRPHVSEFLDAMAPMFELHLYTFGNSEYAWQVLAAIDPGGTRFRGRVITRDDGPEATELVALHVDAESGGVNPEFVNLKQIIPTMGSLATCLVVDDRADVWKSIPNLIQIEPFRAFARPTELVPPMTPEQQKEDRALVFVADKLRRVHEEFYRLYDERKKVVSAESGDAPIPDVREVVQKLRGTVLKGLVLAFSGVIPLQEPPESNYFWSSALRLGASCTKEVSRSVTHLVARISGTAKVRQAEAIESIKIVKPEWLIAATQTWCRPDESPHLLEKSDPLSTSAAAATSTATASPPEDRKSLEPPEAKKKKREEEQKKDQSSELSFDLLIDQALKGDD